MDKKIKNFTITDEHLKLVSNLQLTWDYNKVEAPAFDAEKPYGSNDLYRRMIKILNWKVEVMLNNEAFDYFSNNDELPKALKDKLYNLHRELETVIEICIRRLSFETGTYQTEEYSSDWKKIHGDL